GIYNCGYGHGYSVREIVDTVKKVSGKNFKVVESARRPGDPAILVADPTKIKTNMHWQPEWDDIEEIVRTAYLWEKKLNNL
ncbi:MAG TPA: UDP-glucose 4-epimerase GalE, partial [Desulfonauticus sp.]|nr:UDP-glucose 4-epimerase GalE [Desulfonauticus sp.]